MRYKKDILKLICSRGGSNGIAYNGGPFDVYKLMLNYIDTQSRAVEELKPGTLIWISSGNLLSSCNKTSTGREYWNAIMVANFKDIHLIGWQQPGPNYDEHLRTGSNGKKYLA